MVKISVISPIYKGKKYVQNLINMIEENAVLLNKEQGATVELVLVNDYPEEPLKVYYSNIIIITQITNSKNIGIHASRVVGLNKSQGEYILFLDQDDEIDRLFLVKQWNGLLDADAVVCNGFLESDTKRKIIYMNCDIQLKVCDIKNYTFGNPIVSPGQVLIRKSSIPNIWKENILKHNGADDMFLWMLMLGEGCVFNINNDTLYKHNQTGSNASTNYMAMMMSRLEISFILEKISVLNKEFVAMNKEYLVQVLCKNNHHAKIFDKWMTLLEKDIFVDNILSEKGYKSVAVYGMGLLGKHLVKQLCGSKINVKYIIDRNATLSYKNIPFIRIGEQMDKIDAIIVTPVGEYNCIKEELLNYYSCDIVSLQNIIDDLSKE